MDLYRSWRRRIVFSWASWNYRLFRGTTFLGKQEALLRYQAADSSRSAAPSPFVNSSSAEIFMQRTWMQEVVDGSCNSSSLPTARGPGLLELASPRVPYCGAGGANIMLKPASTDRLHHIRSSRLMGLPGQVAIFEGIGTRRYHGPTCSYGRKVGG